MKNFILLFSILFLFHTYIYGQNTAPFQFEDKRKMILYTNIQEKFLDKEWQCYEMLYIEKEIEDSNPMRFFLTINSNQTFIQDNKMGTWQIDSNLLVFKIESDDYSRDRIFMAGAFSVYKITDEDLVLVKKLSSSDKNKMVYRFKIAGMPVPISYLNQRVDSIPKEEELKKMDAKSPSFEIPYSRQDLAVLIREVYFMRNYPLPKKPFSDWTLEALNKEWRRLRSK